MLETLPLELQLLTLGFVDSLVDLIGLYVAIDFPVCDAPVAHLPLLHRAMIERAFVLLQHDRITQYADLTECAIGTEELRNELSYTVIDGCFDQILTNLETRRSTLRSPLYELRFFGFVATASEAAMAECHAIDKLNNSKRTWQVKHWQHACKLWTRDVPSVPAPARQDTSCVSILAGVSSEKSDQGPFWQAEVKSLEKTRFKKRSFMNQLTRLHAQVTS
ncbi:hypothetical protein BCR37DRAFT_392001 [Protomyces lactucae-debilis]|uniref:Uncharacterized protein n=1 Tax=Protomyces lactucae-debilis TaxID=2754530 RepID=A0A1Y2FKC1_PROLT|nr:uncharacterized protein BCR37DRAFT_392001 [Protomyces lactucae-debilis]ORY84422.1 hypothetical protein BCR37DRAFT_392001 [Protomyces lactucae-debilis]